MQIHHLTRAGVRSKKRIGRGGKRGTTSGRGTKGQKSRAGHSIRPVERDIVNRFPKKRGFANKPISPVVATINLGKLSGLFAPGKEGKKVTIDRTVLQAKGVITRRWKGPVKILGSGDASFPMDISGCLVSKSAREKIERAGGSVQA